MKAPNCIVIGAGSVGVNAAILLKSHEFEVELLESEPEILGGAAQVSFVNHGDGFEYFTEGHHATGEFCIEGSLTKALMYPLDFLSTAVCNADRPLRFLVAEGAVRAGLVRPEAFESNARHMMEHYHLMYGAMGRAAGLNAMQREQVFVRHPDKFMRMLTPEDHADIDGIATGAAGTGFGINMPHYFAAVKAVLRQLGIEPRCNTRVGAIRRIAEGYQVETDTGSHRADHVLICSSHHIPTLASLISGAKVTRDFPGTYFLNSMTFLHLPATSDPAILSAASRINFTLMDEHGGMFACIAPPTPTTDGTAAIYFPARGGSHLGKQSSPSGSLTQPPMEWDELIRKGLEPDHPHVKATFEQAKKLYGFLDGYAEVANTACRTVFNVGTEASEGGEKRSVRVQGFDHHAITEDGLITAYAAPKWTNAEFTAVIALAEVLARSGRGELDLSKGNRAATIGRLFRDKHFRDLKASVEDARAYCATSPAPGSERMIVPEAVQFQSSL